MSLQCPIFWRNEPEPRLDSISCLRPGDFKRVVHRNCGHRVLLASRGSAQGPSPPRDAWHPWGRAEPACAGSARPAPHHSGRTWRIRRGLLRQVVQIRAALDAGGSLPGRHEGRFWQIHGYGRSALLWSSQPRLKHRRRTVQGALPPVVGDWPCPCQGRAVETVVRGCRAGHASFRRWIGPRRPCLVVNPGGGAGFMPATFQPQ